VSLMYDVCNEKHKRIDERLDHHDKWLGEHEEKIDRLDRSDAKNTNAIENLCSQLAGQTKAIWGLVSMVAAALISFFFYAVQQGIFK